MSTSPEPSAASPGRRPRFRFALRWMFTAMLAGAVLFLGVRALQPKATVSYRRADAGGDQVYVVQHPDGSWEEFIVRDDGTLRGIVLPPTVPFVLGKESWALEILDAEDRAIVVARHQALMDVLYQRNLHPEQAGPSHFESLVTDLPRGWPRLAYELEKSRQARRGTR